MIENRPAQLAVRVAVHQPSPDGISGTGWTRPLTWAHQQHSGVPRGRRAPAMDLAVGVRIPRGAPSPQLNGPVAGSLTAAQAPDCDQIATTSAGTPW